MSGLIPLDRRYAIPSGSVNIEETVEGVGRLALDEDGLVSTQVDMIDFGDNNKKKNCLSRLKVYGRTTRGRGRKRGSILVTPGQMLIPDMMAKKGEEKGAGQDEQ